MVKLSGDACPKLLLLASCALAMGPARPLSTHSIAAKVLLAKAQSSCGPCTSRSHPSRGDAMG
jgi:hypothetical protein